MGSEESEGGGATAVVARWGGLEGLREPLRRFLLPRCRDENEADDVIQESLLRAARYRGSLTDPHRLRPWVMRIATNVLRDRALRSVRGPSFGLDDELCDTIEGREAFPGDARDEDWVRVEGEELDREAALGHLRSSLGQLKPSDRSVLNAFYKSEESCSTTARRNGVSPHLVKVHLFRARRRLECLMRQRVATARTRRLLGRVS